MADVGEIVYQVQMDVGQLLTSQRQLEQRLNRMDDSFNRTSRAANNTEQSMLSLSKVAGVVASALSAGAIINAVDEWGQMAARIKMALNSVEGDVERYAEIQQRFLEVSNRNGKAIETTQELYAGSATSMKELGYNTTQTVDYIESLSSAFTANATGAQQTESAMNALNRAMVIGTLKGNDWHSVLNATPSVVADIAKELSRLRGGVKVTENDVKKMAMQGGISMKLFADAMIKAREENNALADSMDNTIADGFTKLTNSAKAYYGEMNQTLGITRSVSAGFAVLTDNFEKVSMVANVALAILGARMAGALYSTIKAKISDVSASINQTTATLNAAKASEYAATTAVRKAQADLSSARSAVALAQAEYNVAKGTLAEATALDNLILKKSLASKAALTLTQATQAQTVAIANSSAAARAASLSVNLFKGALGLVGGPAGAAMLAGAAVLYFYQQAKEARENAIKLAEGVDELTAKMKEMSRVQKEAEMAELRKALPELNNELLNAVIAHSKAIGAVKDLESQVAKATPGTSKYTSLTNQLTSAQDDLAIATNNAQKASNNYSRTKSTISLIQADLNGTLKQGAELLQREASVLPNAEAGWNSYGLSIKRATQEKKEFNSQSLVVQWSDKGLDLRKSIERETKLANAKSEVDKRLLQVKFYAEDNDLSEQEVLSLNQLAIAAQEARDAESERNRTTKESTKSTDAAYEALKRQREEIELLNKGYKDGSLEVAKYDAVKALGDKVSPEQIKLAEKLAEDKFNIQKAAKNKELALEVDTLRKLDEERKSRLNTLDDLLTNGDISFELHQRKRLEIASEYSRKIAEESARNSVSPIEENRAQFDPVQQLKNENAKKLALMDSYYADEMAIINQAYANQQISHEQFTTAKQITDAQYLQIRTAQERQFNEQQTAAQWQMLSQQNLGFDMLTSAVDAMAGSASNAITGLLTGTMTAADAMRSLGNTILNSVVNSIVQTGVEMLKNFIIGKTMGAAAAAASMGEAAIVASAWAPAAAFVSLATMGANAAPANASLVGTTGLASTLAIAGARKNGGPVDAGSMYRVGEGGKPEIFKANNGRQYMIPGDNGKVISNKDMQGGGMNVNVVFNDYSSGGHKFDAQTSQDGNTLTIQAFIMDMDNKGPMLQSITRNTSATARARG